MKPFDLPLVAKRPLGENNNVDWLTLTAIYDGMNHKMRGRLREDFRVYHMPEMQVMGGALHEVLQEQHRTEALEQSILDKLLRETI